MVSRSLVQAPSALATMLKDMNPDTFVTWRDLTKILQTYDETIGAIKGKQDILTLIGLGNLGAILTVVGLVLSYLRR